METQSPKRRPVLTSIFDTAAFFLLLYDTLMGAVASMIFDLSKPWDILNALVFTAALPIFLLAFRFRRTTILLLWCLCLSRWAVECFDGNSPALVNPITWPWGWSLFAGAAVLQLGYLLRKPTGQDA